MHAAARPADTPPPARADFGLLRTMQLRPEDCDATGFLATTAVPRLLEAALQGWLAAVPGGAPRSSALPVADEIALQRAGEVRFPADIVVGLRLSRLTLASARLAVAVFPPDGGPAALTGTVRLGFLDPATRRPVPVPPPLRTALAGLAGPRGTAAGLTGLAVAAAAE